jgi:hypothetical protein
VVRYWNVSTQQSSFGATLKHRHRAGMISGFSRDIDEICALLDATQRRVVFLDWRFGPTYRSHLHGFRGPWRKSFWPLKMGPIGCPETSAQNFHSTLRNIPGGRGSHTPGALCSDAETAVPKNQPGIQFHTRWWQVPQRRALPGICLL